MVYCCSVVAEQLQVYLIPCMITEKGGLPFFNKYLGVVKYSL